MQGMERPDRELLDARALVGHLVAPGSMFAFLADHRQDLFSDNEFEDLFPSGKGRPSIPASVMASILVLQALHDLSDRETAEAVRCDLRWKVATGMALDDKGFDPSTLVYWRKRLAKSDRPQRINEAVRQVVAETGLLRGRGKRAVDSTILADAVATQDTITQLISAIRRVGRIVPGAAEAIAAVCTGHDYGRPGKPVIDWDEPGAKDALVSALVNDANALLEALAGIDEDVAAQESVAAALAMLALVAGQDVEPAEGSDGTDGRWRIARKVAPDRVISQVDPQARHTRKSPEARRDGYRAHVVAEPETGIITDEALTMAAGPRNSDAAVAEQFLANDHAAGPYTRQWYGDSAYGTGDLRGAIHDAGHDAVIKPRPIPAAVTAGFTVDDFTVDEQGATVSCPAGHTRPITKARNVIFGALCHACPLVARCTTSKSGRTISLHQRDDLLRAARRDWAADPDLPQKYRKNRPNVERVVSQIASRGGRRLKLRYRGTTKNHAWLTRRTAGLNLRNLLGRGLTRTAGEWVLAPQPA
ncbi:IS1182 family transposase [Mycobacterium sp. CVI_P3]|uniref:IS1182 family transposase n=1 Tax=Mycobacterium pinniadriaticum TaxID=2994102 RepID=A0ABT3SRF7_9MYCO|nr:IS1182 family transposase [Mycobacterium pinniadriaticum]MCX2935033.1 IS1182 family transposase [Mycobacterium pinniadriaticum]MCX2941455.1 IS1182 family transposase [Mycobacterium pinniadriaticum]